MSFSIRRAAITSISIGLLAALAPIACSSKTPEAEPTITGCTSDTQCPNGYCDSNGLCQQGCVPANNDCPQGQTCGANGRCTTMGTGGTGGSGTGGNGGTGIPVPEAGPDGDGSLPPDAACATATAQAMLEPVSMFVMFDRSGSMVQNQTPPTRWDNAALALTNFFQDPGAADLAIALRYFPHDQPAAGCTNAGTTGCNVMACSQPLIPLMADPTMPLPTLTAMAAPYDTHEAALVASITASIPTTGGGNMGGGTPTSVALDGALQWAAAYQAAHPRPTQQTVVIFVTDGQPNGCDEDFDNISMIASAALAASGVRTYVVGLTDDPQDLAFLQDLAVAGGTETAFIVQDGATAAVELAATLKEIQGSALTCAFPFPTPQDGGVADPTKINVDYTPDPVNSPTMTVPFYNVANLAACTSADQWYYDDNMNPTQINLCPATCTAVTASMAKPRLDIQLGCEIRDPVVM